MLMGVGKAVWLKLTKKALLIVSIVLCQATGRKLEITKSNLLPTFNSSTWDNFSYSSLQLFPPFPALTTCLSSPTRWGSLWCSMICLLLWNPYLYARKLASSSCPVGSHHLERDTFPVLFETFLIDSSFTLYRDIQYWNSCCRNTYILFPHNCS